MSERKPKVIVIGAGPAGATVAYQLARRHASEVVLLDKSRYPRVKVCGSGLSPLALNVLEKIELRERFAARRAVIRGLRIEGRGGRTLSFVAGEGAWVVPRVDLDHGIATAAEAHGARFRPETKVTALLRDGAGQVRGVATDGGELEADLVLCADGAPSRFSTDGSPKLVIQTLMGWWRGGAFPDDQAIMIWDRRLEGYYAWVFPEPGGVHNIGLTIPDGAPAASQLKDLFRALLDEYFASRLRGAEPIGKWMGHPAVITNRIGRIGESHALWLGEAARLVMPGTVEGIGFALESGVAAASHVVERFEARAGFSRAALRRYELGTALRVLPKFWAGEAWARTMRSERARQVPVLLATSPLLPLVERSVARLVGDKRANVVS